MDRDDDKAIYNLTMTGSVYAGVVIISLRDEVMKTLARWEVDTRDTLVREGLIRLGWTPPKENAK